MRISKLILMIIGPRIESSDFLRCKYMHERDRGENVLVNLPEQSEEERI